MIWLSQGPTLWFWYLTLFILAKHLKRKKKKEKKLKWKTKRSIGKSNSLIFMQAISCFEVFDFEKPRSLLYYPSLTGCLDKHWK